MKANKIQQALLLITSVLVLAALAVLPASAQITPPDPTPQAPLLQADEHTFFLPIVSRPPPADLSIAAFEVTQATQKLDNTVSLVAGKASVVRVYAQTDASNGVAGVYVSVSATRNNLPLAGSPLLLGPKTVSTTWSRGDLNTSYNFSLPSDWLSGAVTLQIRVDPNNLIDEGSKETNNTATFQASFTNVPPLEVKVVPITYIDPRTNITYPEASSSYLGPGLVRMYPISSAPVTRRTGITWDDDLRLETNWVNLLRRIRDIKTSDGAPASQVYYGLVPLFNEAGWSWFSSGIAGIGYVGVRVSAGLADASAYGLNGSDIANHEIGHNLGRDHAPCGVTGEDEDYPYDGGLIGQFGLRIDLMQVYDPTIYADIMGYCDPVWISDYNYQALYLAQMAIANASTLNQAKTESLWVRAYLTDTGPIQIEPVYVFNSVPEPLPQQSDYVLELLNEHGILVASYPLPVLQAVTGELRFNEISSLVPLPAEPFVTIRIMKKGVLAAERRMATPGPAPLIQPSLQTGDQGAVLRWGAANTPAVVRYTLDDGETWTTLALDYLGGELVLDQQALPQGNLHFEILLADQPGSTLTLDLENTR